MLLDVAQRRVIKIAVTGTGKEALEKVSGRYGMKEFIVGGKVYEWFARQDDIFQRAVLGLLHGIEMDAARAFMERLASGEEGPSPAGDEEEMEEVGELPMPPSPPAQPSAPASTGKKPAKGTAGRTDSKGRGGRPQGHRP